MWGLHTGMQKEFFEYHIPEHISQQSQNGQNLVIKAVFKDFVLSNRVP